MTSQAMKTVMMGFKCFVARDAQVVLSYSRVPLETVVPEIQNLFRVSTLYT